MKKLALFSLIFLSSLPPAYFGFAETLKNPLPSLMIPSALGKTETHFTGQSERRIIHIQDVHTHLTAQENIAAIVSHLNEIYDIQTVAIEGGWSASSFPNSWGIPSSSRGKQVLAQALLEKAYITGPIHAALFSKTPVTIVGIEDPLIYEENRKLYIKYLESRETVLEKISIWLHTLQEAKANLYNPDLLAFDKALADFREGKKAESFIPDALKHAAAKEIAMEDLAHVQNFKKALELQKSIDKTKLEGEAKRLFKDYQYAHLSVEELLVSGKIPAEKLGNYPQAKKFLEYLQLQKQIPHRELFLEIEEVIKRLTEKLLQTLGEKELYHRSQAITAAKKIMTLQASPADLKTHALYRGGPLASDLEMQGLSNAMEMGLSFYDAAKKRDQIFFEKITTDPRLQGNIAVVTGGFHTEGLTEKFENAGISYEVITPSLGETPEAMDEKLYFERLTEEVHSQTLSEQQNRFATLDLGFQKAWELYQQGERNPEKLLGVISSYRVGKAADASNRILSSAPPTFSDEELENSLKIENARKKAVFMIKQSALEKLLKEENSPAVNVWREVILANPFNVVILFNDRKKTESGESSIFTDTEGKAKIKRTEGDFAQVIARQLSQYGRLGVIDSDYATNNPKIVTLPAEPEALALMRILLENESRFSEEQIKNLMNRMQDLLEALYPFQAVSVSA